MNAACKHAPIKTPNSNVAGKYAHADILCVCYRNTKKIKLLMTRIILEILAQLAGHIARGNVECTYASCNISIQKNTCAHGQDSDQIAEEHGMSSGSDLFIKKNIPCTEIQYDRKL